MRDELNNEELILLWDSVFTQINSQFELWLTITFAVIIASYIAGHRLTRMLQWLIAVLYAAVSLLLMMMLVGAVSFAGNFQAFGAFAEPDFFERFVIALRTGVWLLGTVTTLVFVFYGHREQE